MTYITRIEYDEATGEHFVTIPPELLAALGWHESDALEWTIEDASLLLRRVTET